MTESTFPERIAVDDPPNQHAATVGPVPPRERMVLLDVLRGFALLGMLQVNHNRAADGTVLSNLIDFLAYGSFFTTFAFLFGLGFAIQIIRAEEANRPFVLRYLWRTAILFLIGVVHYTFVRSNEILEAYALFAVILLLVRRWRPRLILSLAAAFLVFTMSPRNPEGHFLTRINPEHVETERINEQSNIMIELANPPVWCHVPGLTGAYSIEVCNNAVRVRRLLTHDIMTVRWWQGGYAVGLFMFLIGLYAGRKRIFQNAAEQTRFLAWVAGVGFVFGVVGNALDVFPEFFAGNGIALPTFFDGWSLALVLGNIGLSLFYLSTITLLYTHRAFARRVLSPLAPVGRMALTNFFMQPIIFITVLGYRGFDIMAGLGPWQNQLLLNAFFAVQVLYSWWWFQHFRFGPLEWLWRSLTWLRIQPIRIGTQPEQTESRKLNHG